MASVDTMGVVASGFVARHFYHSHSATSAEPEITATQETLRYTSLLRSLWWRGPPECEGGLAAGGLADGQLQLFSRTFVLHSPSASHRDPAIAYSTCYQSQQSLSSAE